MNDVIQENDLENSYTIICCKMVCTKKQFCQDSVIKTIIKVPLSVFQSYKHFKSKIRSRQKAKRLFCFSYKKLGWGLYFLPLNLNERKSFKKDFR